MIVISAKMASIFSKNSQKCPPSSSPTGGSNAVLPFVLASKISFVIEKNWQRERGGGRRLKGVWSMERRQTAP
jgi:hypothetical protein